MALASCSERRCLGSFLRSSLPSTRTPSRRYSALGEKMSQPSNIIKSPSSWSSSSSSMSVSVSVVVEVPFDSLVAVTVSTPLDRGRNSFSEMGFVANTVVRVRLRLRRCEGSAPPASPSCSRPTARHAALSDRSALAAHSSASSSSAAAAAAASAWARVGGSFACSCSCSSSAAPAAGAVALRNGRTGGRACTGPEARREGGRALGSGNAAAAAASSSSSSLSCSWG
mmetsp:Transcript_7554/g.31948  ORF Transcript_7554/g.31948 Transcript_7554/m.31948 type:complete len:227 (-) Transcript_7554:586-1266(-)